MRAVGPGSRRVVPSSPPLMSPHISRSASSGRPALLRRRAHGELLGPGQHVRLRRACPAGYTAYWESSPGRSGPEFALINSQFHRAEPVTTTNSFYSLAAHVPRNNGGGGNRTQANVRRGAARHVHDEPSDLRDRSPRLHKRHVASIRGIISFTRQRGEGGPAERRRRPGA